MLAKIMIALGLIATIAGATATPSLAQGVYFEGSGFGVGVGRPAYRDRDYLPGRPGVRVIAKQFGVDPGTVPRSR